MERFRNLNWNPALEDMIDNVFINQERMERESAMYKIMNDCFADPFEDIETDYADVNIQLIKQYLLEDGEDSTDTGEEDQQVVEHVEHEDNSFKREKEKSYVPGIKKPLFYFPRRSYLDRVQQALCLRVLLKLSSMEKRGMNEKERIEFQIYMDLQGKISDEQKEFLEFVKSKWNDGSKWLIKSNKFVMSKWRAKMKRFKKLPRFYAESINIPLSVQKIDFKNEDIKLTFISCLQQRILPKIILPKLDQARCTLFISPVTLLQNYPPCVTPNKVTQYFKLPVSEDTYCENFAKDAEVDFVISSSGLKCLLNNVDPDHSNSWLIPVVVKSHNGKNVVYIDRRLPPTVATVPQKNTWVYKYILRYYFIDRFRSGSLEKTNTDVDVKSGLSEKTNVDVDMDVKSGSSKKTNMDVDMNVKSGSSEKTNMDVDMNVKSGSSEKIKKDKSEKVANYLDSDNDSNNSFNDYLKIYEEDLYLSDTEDTETETDPKINFEMEQNVSYKLFTIGPTESPHEQLKHGAKEYKMLVRTKTDGVEILSNGESEAVILAPKMEHQLEYGAEAITLEEGLHQWTSLKFRPKTSLARVRIAADTAEVIQIESHTAMSLSKEIKRLYNIKVEDSLSVLHNIIERLSSLTPGRYIMRHTPQNGPFAYVYAETEKTDVFDLHTICQNAMFDTTPEIPWPPIDNMMTTPALKCFQKMPAMFNPSFAYQKNTLPARSRGRPRKNANVTNQVPDPLRRSVRLKKNE